MPALFLASKEDKLIDFSHTNYLGEKKFMTVNGDHNHNRETKIIDDILDFLFINIQKKN